MSKKQNNKKEIYQRASDTEGYFSEEEADLLIRSIVKASASATMLEIGSYQGKSTLFALSALSINQQWIVLDNFRQTPTYAGHSYWKLQNHIADARIQILPMSIIEAYRHLKEKPFELIFIDGDHSFLGFAQDIAFSLALANRNATILCHDVCDLFPGILSIVETLEKAGVIEREEKIGTLVKFRIIHRPRWLIDPMVFRGTEL